MVNIAWHVFICFSGHLGCFLPDIVQVCRFQPCYFSQATAETPAEMAILTDEHRGLFPISYLKHIDFQHTVWQCSLLTTPILFLIAVILRVSQYRIQT